jgi:putative FmdB family regulatory protein
MPTYDYQCESCGHRFEKFQSITAAPIRRCPDCGKNRVKRLIGTGAGLIFKGSGFYITDYRDSGYKDKAKSESGATTESRSSDAKSTDSPTSANESTKKSEPAPSKEVSARPSKSSKPSKK